MQITATTDSKWHWGATPGESVTVSPFFFESLSSSGAFLKFPPLQMLNICLQDLAYLIKSLPQNPSNYLWRQTFHFCCQNYQASSHHFDYWNLVTPPHLQPVRSYIYSPRRYSPVWHFLWTFSGFPSPNPFILPPPACTALLLLPDDHILYFKTFPSTDSSLLSSKDDDTLHHVLGTILPQKNLVVIYLFLINLQSYYCFLNSVMGGVRKGNWRDKYFRNTEVTSMVLLRQLHVRSMNFNLS